MKLTEKYTDISYIKFQGSRPLVVLDDKKGGKVSYRGENEDRKELIVYKIDDGIMKDNPGIKCDYGLYTTSSGVIRFIELKGSDLDKAHQQIIRSIRYILNDSVTGINKVHGRIVLSKERVPNIKSNYEKQLEKILKQKNGNLRKACRVLTEVID